MKRVILLVSGFSKSGKDTFADFFVKQRNFKKLAFAEKLKSFTHKKYSFPEKLCYTQEGKNTIVFKNKTVRDLLISDAKILRWEDPDIFVNYVTNKIDTVYPYNHIVISDFRNQNEYSGISKHYNVVHDDIYTIRINRNNITPSECVSEHNLDKFKFDITIDNNFDTVEEFYDYLNKSVALKFIN